MRRNWSVSSGYGDSAGCYNPRLCLPPAIALSYSLKLKESFMNSRLVVASLLSLLASAGERAEAQRSPEVTRSRATGSGMANARPRCSTDQPLQGRTSVYIVYLQAPDPRPR